MYVMTNYHIEKVGSKNIKIWPFYSQIMAKNGIAGTCGHTRFGPYLGHVLSTLEKNYIAVLRRLRAFERALICIVLD